MPENLELCPYRQAYLDAIVAGWNTCLVHDALTRKRFVDEVLLDENFDPALALMALVGGELAGFCLAIRRKYPYLTRGLEETRGWISVFFVLPQYRRKGVGTALLQRAETLLLQRGTKEITLCAYSPNYFTPGVDVTYPGGTAFFDAQGYTRGTEAVSMQRDLFTYTIPAQTQQKMAEFEKQGITFTPFTMAHMEDLLAFTAREFDAGWVRNILLALRTGKAQDTILLALGADGKVIGYCMRKIDGNDARFGPIGVAEALRGAGLGGVLIDLQMMEMKKRGIYSFYFLWTHGDAIRFYERHGLNIYRTYQLYRKKI